MSDLYSSLGMFLQANAGVCQLCLFELLTVGTPVQVAQQLGSGFSPQPDTNLPQQVRAGEMGLKIPQVPSGTTEAFDPILADSRNLLRHNSPCQVRLRSTCTAGRNVWR